MNDKNTYWIFKIKKRPFHIWLLRIVWVLWLVFWAEVALGSKAELEPKAFALSAAIFLVSLLAGLALWWIGLRKFRKQKEKL